MSINVGSLQVWCYECDEYIEGWDLLNDLKEKLDEQDSDPEIENNPKRTFGAGKLKTNTKTNNKNVVLIFTLSLLVGLYNSGNSCFINAALQILLNCPTLLGFFHDQCKSFVLNRDKSGHNSNQPSISEHFMALVDAVNNPEW